MALSYDGSRLTDVSSNGRGQRRSISVIVSEQCFSSVNTESSIPGSTGISDPPGIVVVEGRSKSFFCVFKKLYACLLRLRVLIAMLMSSSFYRPTYFPFIR